MSRLVRCDWCGREAHPDAPLVELRAIAFANEGSCDTSGGWVGHYHQGTWRGPDGMMRTLNCFGRMRDKLALIHEYAPAALENTPVVTNQKIAQLRRKHRTDRQDAA